MYCDEIKNLIIKYFDNDLSESESILLNQHLQTCQNCKTEFDEMEHFFSILQQEKNELVESRESYFNEIDALEIVNSKRRKRLFNFELKPAFSLAVVVLIGFVLFFTIGKNNLTKFNEGDLTENEQISNTDDSTVTIYEDYITTYLNQNYILDNLYLKDFSEINYFNDVINMLNDLQHSLINNSYGFESVNYDELTENEVQEIIAQLETKQF
ncbi:MAG: zf-HC2 domain-containing protein [Ignavibacterium sp.]|nr:zf-HC2 domain-containing protein [Ignavibacterium sp.]